jgi:hypothetical protein
MGGSVIGPRCFARALDRDVDTSSAVPAVPNGEGRLQWAAAADYTTSRIWLRDSEAHAQQRRYSRSRRHISSMRAIQRYIAVANHHRAFRVQVELAVDEVR